MHRINAFFMTSSIPVENWPAELPKRQGPRETLRRLGKRRTGFHLHADEVAVRNATRIATELIASAVRIGMADRRQQLGDGRQEPAAGELARARQGREE